jgi:hypothetical protein
VFKSSGWEVAPVGRDLLDDFNGKINVFMTGSSSTSGIEIYNIVSIPAFDQAEISYKSGQPRIGSFGGSLQEHTLYLEIGSKQ